MTSSSHVCGPCQEYNKVAVVYCSICEKTLCEECKEEHGSVKILKTHMLRDIKELPPIEITELLKSLIVCPNHDNEEVVYLCKDHKVTCCNKCVIADHRKCDEVCVLADIRPNSNAEGAGLKNILHDLNKKGHLLINHETTHKELLKETELRANRALQNIKETIMNAYNNLERDVLVSIAKKKERILINMDRQTACLQKFLIEVQSQTHQLEQVEKFGSNVHAILMERKLQQAEVVHLQEVAQDLEKTRSKTGFSCIESGSLEKSIKELNNALHIYDAECDETAEKGSDAYIDIDRLVQFKETFRKTLMSMQFRKHGFCKEAVNEFGLIDKNFCIAGDEGGVVLLFHDAETCFVAKAECQYKPWSFSKTEPNEIVVYMPDFNIIDCEDIKPVRFRFVKKDFK